MVSNWILDISIRFLLLLSIGLFYEMTAIFYTTFNWWIVMLLLPFTAVSSLVDRWQKRSIDNSEIPIQAQHIESTKAAEKYIIFQSISTQKKSIDAPEIPMQIQYVEPDKADNRYTLLQSSAIAVAWLIPIVVDLMFSSVAVFVAYLLNDNLNLDDVYLICLLPAIILFVTCFSKRLREMLSNNINSSIYSSFGAIGIVANTFVIEWGGYSIAKILGIAL
jgi:hypothetical protein